MYRGITQKFIPISFLNLVSLAAGLSLTYLKKNLLLDFFLGHPPKEETMNCRPADNPSFTTMRAMFIKIRVCFLAISIGN